MNVHVEGRGQSRGSHQPLSPLLSEQGFSRNLALTSSAVLATELPQGWDSGLKPSHTACFLSCWESEPKFLFCIANTLLTAPSLQPLTDLSLFLPDLPRAEITEVRHLTQPNYSFCKSVFIPVSKVPIVFNSSNSVQQSTISSEV